MRRIRFWLVGLSVLALACGVSIPAGWRSATPTPTPAATATASEAAPARSARSPSPREPRGPRPPTATPARPGVVLFTIGVHVEPLGTTAQGYGAGTHGDYHDPRFLQRHREALDALARVVEAHGGVLVVQVQSPFTTALLAQGDPLLADLAARGHEIGLHFHEDVHVGPAAEQQPPEVWCAALREEVQYAQQAAGGAPVRYWSGGNLYPRVLDAAACAGLDIYGDWKDPRSQQAPAALLGLQPWRPAGGTDGRDFTALLTPDPAGPVVYLPQGVRDWDALATARRADDQGQAYFAAAGQQLQAAVQAAQGEGVFVFHLTVHPGEFRGSAEQPFAALEAFLTTVVDPLVAQDRVRWATFSQMADAFQAWERASSAAETR